MLGRCSKNNEWFCAKSLLKSSEPLGMFRAAVGFFGKLREGAIELFSGVRSLIFVLFQCRILFMDNDMITYNETIALLLATDDRYDESNSHIGFRDYRRAFSQAGIRHFDEPHDGEDVDSFLIFLTRNGARAIV